MSKLEVFSEKMNKTIEFCENDMLESMSRWDNGHWEHGSYWNNYHG